MKFTPRVTLAMVLAGALGIVAATNLWPDFEYGYSMLGQIDTARYRVIAQAAPGIPDMVLPYHHAQRFWIYWLLGVIANKSGFSADLLCRLAVFGLLLSIAWVLWRILQLISPTLSWQMVIATAWACNPFCTRYYLAVPWMCADLLFALGFSITLMAILQRKNSTAACGLIVAAFGRQTALALMLATWIALGWQQRYKKLHISHLATITLASAAVVGIYWAGGLFADGAVNTNLKYLTGFADWIVSDQPDKLSQLMGFGLRAIISQGPALTLLSVLLIKRTQSLQIDFWITALFVASVWAQPILAGPNITGSNIVRLGSLAYIGLLAMVALIAKDSRKNLAPWTTWAIAVALLCGSFYPQWSWPGLMLLSTREAFGILSASIAVLVGIIAFFGNNIPLREPLKFEK